MSLLHAYLVFVTKYRRKVFTDDMLTFCEHTMAEVCADLDAAMVEFNGEAWPRAATAQRPTNCGGADVGSGDWTSSSMLHE